MASGNCSCRTCREGEGDRAGRNLRQEVWVGMKGTAAVGPAGHQDTGGGKGDTAGRNLGLGVWVWDEGNCSCRTYRHPP